MIATYTSNPSFFSLNSHPPASGFEHASTDARDSIRKWYIERGLYTVIWASGRKFEALDRLSIGDYWVRRSSSETWVLGS